MNASATPLRQARAPRRTAGPSGNWTLALSSVLGVCSCSAGGMSRDTGAPAHDMAGAGGVASTGSVAERAGAGALENSYPNLGVCGRRGEAKVSTNTFKGYEEIYLIGEEGLGQELCVLRFDLTRVGPAPSGCDAHAGQQGQCLWTHQVEYGPAHVELEEANHCATSELGLTPLATAAIEGSQGAYGFVAEYQGHSSVLMRYDLDTRDWNAAGQAIWEPSTGDFRFDRREGFCGYSSP